MYSKRLRTLIIDDEPIALEKLASYVAKVPFLELVGECGSGLEAVDLIARGLEVDLMFTDISMPDLDGLEMMRSLPAPPMVVFITAFDRYAVESYRLSAIDYLLKPYGFADFQRAAMKALDYHSSRSVRPAATEDEPSSDFRDTISNDNDSIFIKVDYRYVRVALADIRYIKGFGEYLQIYIVGAQSPLVPLSSFSALKEKLPENFLQVHRSFIVNMNHVKHIERGRIVMDADSYIPVGDSYKADFNRFITLHSIGKTGK